MNYNNLKKELKKYLIVYPEDDDTWKDLETYEVYENLFKKPVKCVFKWVEENCSGTVYVIYQFIYQSKLYYIVVKGRFGSCAVCDILMDNHDKLIFLREIERIFEKDITIYDSIDKIPISKYSHPNLVKNLETFIKK